MSRLVWSSRALRAHDTRALCVATRCCSAALAAAAAAAVAPATLTSSSSDDSSSNSRLATTTTTAATTSRAALSRPLYFRARWRYSAPFCHTSLRDYFVCHDDSGTCRVRAHTFYSATDDITVTLVPTRHFAHPRFFAQVDLLCAQHMSVLMEGVAPLSSSPWSTMVPARAMPTRMRTDMQQQQQQQLCNDEDDGNGDGRVDMLTATTTTTADAPAAAVTSGDDALPRLAATAEATASAQIQRTRSSSSGDNDNSTAVTTRRRAATAVAVHDRESLDLLRHFNDRVIAYDAHPSVSPYNYDDRSGRNSLSQLPCSVSSRSRDEDDDDDDAEGWEPLSREAFFQPMSWGVAASPQHTVVHAADAYNAGRLPWWFALRHNLPLVGSRAREKHCLRMLRPLRARGYRSFAIPWGAAHMPTFDAMLRDNGYALVGCTSLLLCHRIDGSVSDGEYVRIRRDLRCRRWLRAMATMLLMLLVTSTLVLTMHEVTGRPM